MEETHYDYETNTDCESYYANNSANYELDNYEKYISNQLLHIAKSMREEKDSKKIGALGESYATLKLMQKGWILLDRNWHCRFGELDIVMITPKKILVFVEVKTRRSIKCGTPMEAITYKKCVKTRKTAMKWLQENGSKICHYITRFDAISITIATKNVNNNANNTKIIKENAVISEIPCITNADTSITSKNTSTTNEIPCITSTSSISNKKKFYENNESIEENIQFKHVQGAF